MKDFAEVWRSGEVLEAQYIIPLVRRFTLDCLADALQAHGVQQETIRDMYHRGLERFQTGPDTMRLFEESPSALVPEMGLKVSMKSYKAPFGEFERVTAFVPPGRWRVSIRVELERLGEDAFRVAGVRTGLLYWEKGEPPAEEAAAKERNLRQAWRQDEVRRDVSRLDRENFMVGYRFDRWPGSTAELVAAIGDMVEEALPVLRLGPNIDDGIDMVMPTMKSLAEHLRDKGYRFTSEQVATLYGALKAKGFVILSGLSGTGKTKLAQELAALLGGDEQHLLLEPVRPDWRDSTGLLGYWNPVTRTYEAPRFLTLVLDAAEEYRFARLGTQSPRRPETGFTAFVRGRLGTDPWAQQWLGEYRQTLIRYQGRTSGWTDEELDDLWRERNNGITPIKLAPEPIISYDDLRTATDMLADRTRPVAQRALDTLHFLKQAGEPFMQRARVIRVLAALQPNLVPGLTRREDVLLACDAVGVPLRIRSGDHHLWVDLQAAWGQLQDRLRALLTDLDEEADDPALRGVTAWLAREYAEQHAAAAPAAVEVAAPTEPVTAHSARPYFVILDEMNLARVEYYLAELLSVMETGRAEDGFTRGEIYLHGQAGPIELPDGREVPTTLRLPPNLYLIGTVNMDETTFAFSPKVLDRAFTIEFREVDLTDYPDGADGTEAESLVTLDVAELLTDFTRSGHFAGIEKADVRSWASGRQSLLDALQALNRELFPYDLHFGYRVVDEILAFIGVLVDSPVNDALTEEEAFDAAVMMKVLPKFHGPRHRLHPPLEAVRSWAGPKENPRFPRTFRKAEQMWQKALDFGHTSYS